LRFGTQLCLLFGQPAPNLDKIWVFRAKQGEYKKLGGSNIDCLGRSVGGAIIKLRVYAEFIAAKLSFSSS
jgi:hypothetical protein